MPRISSDSTITHRIEIGLTERKKLDEIIAAQVENQRLDAITNTLQAAGTAIGGGGALLAGLALSAWLAPSFVKAIRDKLDEWTTSSFSPVVNEYTTDVIEKRRAEFHEKMKASLEREKELNERKVQFCTPSSKDFDNEICDDLTLELEELLQARQALIQEASDIQGIVDEEIEKLEEILDAAASVNPLLRPVQALWYLWGKPDED